MKFANPSHGWTQVGVPGSVDTLCDRRSSRWNVFDRCLVSENGRHAEDLSHSSIIHSPRHLYHAFTSWLLLFRSTIDAENRDILLFEVVCVTLRWEGDFSDRMGLVPDILCEVEDL
jgi:hypothetical protein